MIKLVLIEDEAEIRKEIIYLIESEPDIEMVGWSDNVQAAAKLIDVQRPDVILMDIQLRDGTAFDVLKLLSEIPPNIIFLTAYNHFAIKAIKYGALDYLLKPIDQSELAEAIERFRRRSTNDPHWMQQLSLAQNTLYAGKLPESIVLSTIHNLRIVEVKDIIYCKGDGPYTSFFISGGNKEVVSKPLKFYEELLPAPFFLRTHQSYLVNRRFISSVDRSGFVVLKNEEKIPISLRRKNDVLTKLIPGS
ncbi:LytTR family DNA-binding domain-containing protein [uncultured Mucilaginibacter sp.]|uniref:LytR/AlgR family response regulator transcription factor n=1 Tax=uncultured Mucilaginibacter sp. TaxID=797541 RepID=UPI0025DC73CF|nr:LytTR family DNA-binding domain-containing protein [uncultured Mucilaginibacter sp.]